MPRLVLPKIFMITVGLCNRNRFGKNRIHLYQRSMVRNIDLSIMLNFVILLYSFQTTMSILEIHVINNSIGTVRFLVIELPRDCRDISGQKDFATETTNLRVN